MDKRHVVYPYKGVSVNLKKMEEILMHVKMWMNLEDIM
jgi:hypothetical protein